MNVGASAGPSSACQPNSKRLKKILNERCDGNRNIFHAAVFACAPVSNSSSTCASTQPMARATGQSSLRPSKFSDSGLSDIYAAYGKYF